MSSELRCLGSSVFTSPPPQGFCWGTSPRGSSDRSSTSIAFSGAGVWGPSQQQALRALSPGRREEPVDCGRDGEGQQRPVPAAFRRLPPASVPLRLHSLFVLDKVQKWLDEYLIDFAHSDESFSLRIDSPTPPPSTRHPPLPYVHQSDLHLFIIPAEAWLSLSMVCCTSDTPLCNWGNVTVIHQAICLFGEVNFYRPSFWIISTLPCPCPPFLSTRRCSTFMRMGEKITSVQSLHFQSKNVFKHMFWVQNIKHSLAESLDERLDDVVIQLKKHTAILLSVVLTRHKRSLHLL